jgi:hypothetical protein
MHVDLSDSVAIAIIVGIVATVALLLGRQLKIGLNTNRIEIETERINNPSSNTKRSYVRKSKKSQANRGSR